jgi:hypothetical protein
MVSQLGLAQDLEWDWEWSGHPLNPQMSPWIVLLLVDICVAFGQSELILAAFQGSRFDVPVKISR